MVIVLCGSLTACNFIKSGEEKADYPTTSVSSIDISNSAENIISRQYENLVFSEDFRVEFPNIESFASFKMIQKPGVSVQEIYEHFDAAVDMYFPDAFTADEKKGLYQLVGEGTNGELISGKYEAIKNDIADDNNNAMLLVSDKGTLQMFGCGYTQTATGKVAYSLDYPEGGNVGMYIAADNNTIKEKIFIPQGGAEEERVYSLLDGEVKLTEAIAYTEEFFESKFDREVANPELIPEVCEAWVVDMGDGIYGYHLVMTPTYQGIRFDAQPMNRAGASSPEPGSNCKNYENFPGYAFTLENKKLDSIMIVGAKLAYDIEPIKTYTEMITVEQATEILSEAVSGHVGLVLERAEFLYAPYLEEGGEGSPLTVDAVWRYVGRNKNDGFRYLFYVNAVTGEIDYYKYS